MPDRPIGVEIADNFAREMEEKLDVQIETVDEPEQAVKPRGRNGRDKLPAKRLRRFIPWLFQVN